MSKKYIKLPKHGINGDFYRYCDSVFRADNLEIATQIAFNRWLERFNNFGHECSLRSIEPGKFIVDTDQGVVTSSDISYYGPADMFTDAYKLAHCTDSEVRSMADAMQEALDAGHPAVRKSRTSGAVIFTEEAFVNNFNRRTPDGKYVGGIRRHLSTDPVIAKMQMEAAGIKYE